MLNIKVIWKKDKKALSILERCTYSVVYEYNINTMSWKRIKVEGFLILYERDSNNQKLGIFIFNRVGLENYSILFSKNDKIISSEKNILKIFHFDIESQKKRIIAIWASDEKKEKSILRKIINYIQKENLE